MRFFIPIFAAFVLLQFARASDPTSDALCRDDLTFRSCYGITRDQCLEYAKTAVNECLAEMPRQPARPSSVTAMPNSRWGQWNVQLGHCAEEFFAYDHRDSFNGTDECIRSRASLSEESRNYNYRHTKGAVLYYLTTVGGYLRLFGFQLTIGVLASILFLQHRLRKRSLTVFSGLSSWVVFVAGAFVGELLAHVLTPETYKGLGDDPSQVGGFILTLMASLILNPLLWLFFFVRVKKVQRCSK